MDTLRQEFEKEKSEHDKVKMSNNRILSQLQQQHDKTQNQNKHDEQEIMLNKGDQREKVCFSHFKKSFFWQKCLN